MNIKQYLIFLLLGFCSLACAMEQETKKEKIYIQEETIRILPNDWDISMLSQLAGATAQHAAAICDYIDPITQNEGAQPDGWQKPITWQGIADILSSKKESQAVLEKLGLTQTAETFPV